MSRWVRFKRCEDCGAPAKTACKTVDDDVADEPCPGRKKTGRGLHAAEAAVVDVVEVARPAPVWVVSRAVEDAEPDLARVDTVSLGGDHTLGAIMVAHIDAVLDRLKGNKSQASAVLGVDRRTLQRMLQRRASHGPRLRRGPK